MHNKMVQKWEFIFEHAINFFEEFIRSGEQIHQNSLSRVSRKLSPEPDCYITMHRGLVISIEKELVRFFMIPQDLLFKQVISVLRATGRLIIWRLTQLWMVYPPLMSFINQF